MDDKIQALKKKLETIGTVDLLGMIGVHFMTFASNAKGIAEESNMFSKTELLSPQKQYTYLAGLLMSTADNSNSSSLRNGNDDFFTSLERDVQEITLEYAKGFLEIDEGDDPEKIKRNLVSLEAFVSYFDMGTLRYPEQTIKLIKALYGDFDQELHVICGLTTDDFLAFYQFVYDEFDESIQNSQAVIGCLKNKMYSFNPFSVDIENAYSKFSSAVYKSMGVDIKTALDNMSTVKRSSVISAFGEEKAERLLSIFSLKRENRNYMYYNGKNPFAAQPLCWIDNDETLFVIHPTFLMTAIYNYITEVLEDSKNKFLEKYKKAKADSVEKMFLDVLKSILGNGAVYHTSVCEERGTKEHDIVIEYGNYILIAEAKASKVREPFFNPEKAFDRIRDHFNSDIGIGGAYAQAIILKKLLESKDSIVLYENKKSQFTINDISKKRILPIVLTLNQFGSLAINTSLLLEKDSNQPYPWVCNLHDLQNIVEILQHLNKSPDDFINYIGWRSENHNSIVSSDELDIIESYFLSPDFRKKSNDETVFFPADGPSLIDKIYYEKHGIPYEYSTDKFYSGKKRKIGRNEKCPCGSGLKFKRCCYKKGIYD